MSGISPVKRALISVWDKQDLAVFARGLKDLNVEIVSTGGTARVLREWRVEVKETSDLTGFAELLEGRVKSLHPKIHAGILAVRDNPEHLRQMNEVGALAIDLVCVNLYPFQATARKPEASPAEIIEMIDIGGPALIRSAAKNHAHVAVVVSPEQYRPLLSEMKEKGGLSGKTRRALAQRAFRLTSDYDAAIANYLASRG